MSSICILGIDPGSRITGFGVLEKKTYGPARYIASGCIFTKETRIESRLEVLHKSLSELIQTYQPHAAAIERVFVGKNANSALVLGQARGVLLLALAQARIPIQEYASRMIKQTVTGYGNASKTAVSEMVKRLLNLPSSPAADAADALAAALTYFASPLQTQFSDLEKTGSP